MKKHTIVAIVCLIASLAVTLVTGANFVEARSVPEPIVDPSATERKMLSDWFPALKGTAGDTAVYIMRGKEDGGSMLILGGTHANEVSGYMSAFVFLENAAIEQGTVYVIPYSNHSAMTHNDPGEGAPQFFTLHTKSGERTFRYGSRATSPADQWPDPDVYVHASSGQQLTGSETRNLNRAFPGKADGTLTEQIAFGITELIGAEAIDLTFDLHEASPEYPVINATVAHENSMNVAAFGIINLLMEGIEMSLEPSPVNFHGLTHRELGDYTDTLPLLMETANASQGRLRGATNAELALTGKDKCYVLSAELGMLYVPYDENGHPVEERVGRHLQGVYEYSKEFSAQHPDSPIAYGGVPGYAELFASSDGSDLGGARLGTYLN